MMTLDVNQKEMILLGVKFEHRDDFDAVWYAVSSNMIEGWSPEPAFIEKMKQRMTELRKRELIAKE